MMCGWGKLTLSLGLLLAMAGEVAPQPCPAQCSCSGSTVDCHGLALRVVPRNIPRNTERLDLNGNNITRITKTDFAGLRHLRVLLVLEEGHFEFYEEKFVTVEPRSNICDAVLEVEALAKVS
ncbi:hypothetical protein Q9233_010973 [Columba guinea]|nr:hypothetical protein Q9233_010973 [Columba guinea]